MHIRLLRFSSSANMVIKVCSPILYAKINLGLFKNVFILSGI